MRPFGNDTPTSSSRNKSISTPKKSGHLQAPVDATPHKPGKFNKFLGAIGIHSTDSLHLPSRTADVIADLVEWGLTQEQAEGIANQPDYLAAHGPALAWAAVAPEKACQLINAALPLLPDPSVRTLLVQCADQLALGIDPGNTQKIGDALVKLVKGGWSTLNSQGFVPEDVRATLTALAKHINPLVGLRVNLEDARLRVESASLDQLPDLMVELTQHSAEAMLKNYKDVSGPLLDIRDLADRLARRADTPELWKAARQLNAHVQQWRMKRAERNMKDWLTIEPVQDLQTGAPTVKVTVNPRGPHLLDDKSRAGAQKWFREWLRAETGPR